MLNLDQIDAIEQAANHGHAVAEILLNHVCNPEADDLSEDILVNLLDNIAHQLRSIRDNLEMQDHDVETDKRPRAEVEKPGRGDSRVAVPWRGSVAV